MKPLFLSLLTTIILTVCSIQAFSQDYVYRPKNPAFGGNYLNYQWLLSSANAQNTIEEKSSGMDFSSYGRYDPMNNFKEDLQRRFFDELSRQIVNSYFGEGGYQGENIEDGSYSFGNYEIDIFTDSQGLNILIRDFAEGGETIITIPNY